MFQKKVAKKAVGCLMALTMVMTNSYMGINVGGRVENVAYAEEGELSYTIGNSTYNYLVLENGSIEITGYNGTDTEIVIPAEIDGKSVTSIGDWAFIWSINLSSVKIPDSVTGIGDAAFIACNNLTKLEIPNSVTSIGGSAFKECSSLTSVKIPENLTSIDGYTFCECSSLTSLIIPDGVTSIGAGAFDGCSSLTEIIIPNGVSSISEYTFCGCSSLTSVELPNSITNINEYAFQGCSSLTNIIIPNGVASINEFTFDGCSSLTSVEIPKSVSSIGDFSFGGCSSLTSVEIPKSVSSIGYFAFDECERLEKIEVENGNEYYKSEEGVLFNEDMSELIKYPAGKKDDIYFIPDSVTGIGGSAFRECSFLTSVEIPDSVTSISVYEFLECNRLEEIRVNEGNMRYKSIDGVLFSKGTVELIKYPAGKKDTNYVIPKVGTIGNYAFEGCSNLISVEIPDSIMSIGNYAFEHCSSLICVEIQSGVRSIFTYAFSGCSSLERVEIPSSVRKIGLGAFDGCGKLTIYGEKGSRAEQYAGSNIPFIAIKMLSDDITDINVKFIEDDISKNVSLKTKQITSSDEEYNNIIFTDKIVDSTVKPEDVKFTAYDISLVDEENTPVQPKENVTVKIPCPSDYNGENCNVYRVSDTGDFTDMNAIYRGGNMVFETESLGTYIITETELITQPNVIKGDANCDGNMDIKDSAIIKRYLAGWDVEINMTAADMDGDGKVTIKDSALIKRQLAGWE